MVLSLCLPLSSMSVSSRAMPWCNNMNCEFQIKTEHSRRASVSESGGLPRIIDSLEAISAA